MPINLTNQLVAFIFFSKKKKFNTFNTYKKSIQKNKKKKKKNLYKIKNLIKKKICRRDENFFNIKFQKIFEYLYFINL